MQFHLFKSKSISVSFGLIGHPREIEVDTEELGRCPTLKELSGSFLCPVYSTDTWDLGLNSHPATHFTTNKLPYTMYKDIQWSL